jgi:hypothetical protein
VLGDPTAQRPQSRRQSPARAIARPTILFFARRAIRCGLPDVMVETSFASRAVR